MEFHKLLLCLRTVKQEQKKKKSNCYGSKLLLKYERNQSFLLITLKANLVAWSVFRFVNPSLIAEAYDLPTTSTAKLAIWSLTWALEKFAVANPENLSCWITWIIWILNQNQFSAANAILNSIINKDIYAGFKREFLHTISKQGKKSINSFTDRPGSERMLQVTCMSMKHSTHLLYEVLGNWDKHCHDNYKQHSKRIYSIELQIADLKKKKKPSKPSKFIWGYLVISKSNKNRPEKRGERKLTVEEKYERPVK